MGEAVSVSFDSYLIDILGVVSIEEAWRELDVRRARNVREQVMASIASLCARLGVTSIDEMWEEVDRKISTEKKKFENGLSGETARKACLGELLQFRSKVQGAQSFHYFKFKEETINEYLDICRRLLSDEDFWEEVDRRIFAERAAIKDKAVKGEAFSQDRSKDDTSSPTTSLENANLTTTTK
ncbi:MAG: hypothetical protein Q9192_002354 [Flavoplaca navasiana]